MQLRIGRVWLVFMLAVGAVAALVGSAGAADVMEAPQTETYPAPTYQAPAYQAPAYPAPSSMAPLGTAVFIGGRLQDDDSFGYLGFVHAANGDLGQSGLLYRAVGGLGRYTYATSSVAGGKVDADLTSADGMLGYQWFAPSARLAAFAGFEFQNRDLSPKDPANVTRGDALGLKVQGEAETLNDMPYYGAVSASYSTANEDYNGRLRLGARYGSLVIGPELGFQGDSASDTTRYGAFIKGIPLGNLDTELSLGYADTSGRAGPDSVYLGAGLSVAF